MTACNSDKCHCPKCIESRREEKQEARLGALETRVGGLEHREHRAFMARQAGRCKASEGVHYRAFMARQRDYEREQNDRYMATEGAHIQRTTARGKIFVGYKEDKMIEWRWQQIGPGKWQRQMIYPYREPLGPVVYRRYFTPDGNPIRGGVKIVEGHTPRSWTESNAEDEGCAKFGSPTWEAAHGVKGGEGRVGDVASLFTPVGKISFPNLKERTAMSPSALAILFYVHAHSPRLGDPDVSGTKARDGYLELLQGGLIREDGYGSTASVTLTERGEVFVKAVRALPLPVREPAPWVMPKA